jgi:hypothetical protein
LSRTSESTGLPTTKSDYACQRRLMAISKSCFADRLDGSTFFEPSRMPESFHSHTNVVGSSVSMPRTNFGSSMANGSERGEDLVHFRLVARDLLPRQLVDTQALVVRAFLHDLTGAEYPLSSSQRYLTRMMPFGDPTTCSYQPSNSSRPLSDKFRGQFNSRFQSATLRGNHSWFPLVPRRLEPAVQRRLGSRHRLLGKTCPL